MIALTWGSNLAAVYPFVEIIFDGHTISSWAIEQEDELNDELAKIDGRIAQADETGPAIDGLRDKRNRLEKWKATFKSIGPWAERWAPSTPFGTLVAVIVFILTMTLARCVLLGINMVLVTRVSQGVVFRLQNRLFRKLLGADLRNIEKFGTGALASRIHHETIHIGAMVRTLAGKMMREPLKLLICLAGAAFVNWRLLILSLLICPAAMFVLLKIARAIKETTQRSLQDSAGLMNQLIESLTYIKAIKAHNMEAAQRRDIRRTTSQIYGMKMRISMFDALLRGNNEVLGTGVLCLSFFAGGYLVLGGHTHIWGIRMATEPMTFSTLALFYGLLLGTTDPLRKLGGVHMSVRVGTLAANRLFRHVDQPRSITNPTICEPIPQEPSHIEFRSVAFGYLPNRPVLRRVSLEIPAKQKVAIIGPNGSGKSTLVDLLPRFYDPNAGEVLINGTPLTGYALRDIRRYVTIVSQQAALFDDTIAANIAYGSGTVSEEEIAEAAKRAYVMEFAEQLPDKLQTRIGQHGDRLSGGERQRVSIARAILRNSPVVILDEATSQIDQESERLIHQALKLFLEERTAIMITHRDSTLELADRVIVMDEGRIVADGANNSRSDWMQLIKSDNRKAA